MEVDPRYTQDISALEKMFVSITKEKRSRCRISLNGNRRSSTVGESSGIIGGLDHFVQPPTGKSLSDASAAIDRAMTQLVCLRRCAAVLPEQRKCSRRHELTGDPDYRRHRHGIYRTGILYESYVHPLTILSTLPSAGSERCWRWSCSMPRSA